MRKYREEEEEEGAFKSLVEKREFKDSHRMIHFKGIFD